ncbi:MAG: dockerin type I repeat-containing protein, partial [Acutalibacteraceae bacterium]
KGSLSKVEKVEVPTISNLALHEGQVLRVEFTNFTPTDSPWLQRILGSFAVKHSGDYPQEQDVPAQSQLPIRYEAYDYLTAVATNSAVNSPWNVQVNLNSSGWNNVDASYSATDGYSYLHWSGYEWGGNWPGINSYQPANYSELDRYYLAFVTASNIYGNVADTAYTFTAPFTGNYHIGKADQLKVLSFDETNYFKFRTSNAPENAKCGVRITVDGKTVWPTADDEYYDDGYACFGPSADLPDAIEIPELDVFMTSNSVLRVEYSQRVPGINDVTMPWDIETTGIVSATLTAIEGIAAPVSREIETLGLYDSADDVAITTSYVLGSGTFVANSNTATLTNDGVHLSFKAFSQGLSLSLNGFEFKLDGSNTMLVAGEENYPITIAEADDGIYNLIYNVQPAFSANKIIGTNVSLTINGVSYEHMFAGASPSIGRNNTIVIENNSDDDITIMPGDLQIVSGSGFKVIGTVLYVGETTSIDAVKAGIVSNTKYVFIDENVATGKYFMRDGLDDVFYSLAVKGDVNGDGFVNVTDLVRFKKGLSGNVELSDAQKVAANFGNTELSDAQALINIRKNLLGL